MAIPLINGKSYGWNSIKLHLLNVLVNGVTKISYSDEQEKTNNHGRGKYAVSRGQGKYEAKASITLEMKEVVAIQSALPKGKRLQDIKPFDIEVAYVDEDNLLVVDTIKNAEFKNNGREINAGDGSIQVELELVVSHIEWNGSGTPVE